MRTKLNAVKIAMWSGPRNISTALMRSFENRPDCFVSDEPFYSYFLYKTGLKHPLSDEIIKSGDSTLRSDISLKDDTNAMRFSNVDFCDTRWYSSFVSNIHHGHVFHLDYFHFHPIV